MPPNPIYKLYRERVAYLKELLPFGFTTERNLIIEEMEQRKTYFTKELVTEKTFLRATFLSFIDTQIQKMEGRMQKFPKTKCINLEMHLHGSCFACERIKGNNSALVNEISPLKEAKELIEKEI